jgi:hypothetical protein
MGMFGKEQKYEDSSPLIRGVKEKHTVTYPKCDVCGENVHFAVEFSHIKSRQDEYNRSSYHSTYFTPAVICRGCLTKAMEFPVDLTKCNYCGK